MSTDVHPPMAMRLGNPIATALALSLMARVCIFGQPTTAPPANLSAADSAWATLQAVSKPYPGYHDRNAASPPQQTWEAYKLTIGDQAVRVADQARDFYVRFPGDGRVNEAKASEGRALTVAAEYGRLDACDRMDAMEADLLKQVTLVEAQRFRLLCQSAHRRVFAACFRGQPVALAAAESQVRGLLSTYPQKSEIHYLLLKVANHSPPDKAKAIAQDLLQYATKDDIKRVARDIIAGQAYGKTRR